MLTTLLSYIETYTLYDGDFVLVEYKPEDLFPEGKYYVLEQVIDKAGNFDLIWFEITVNSGKLVDAYAAVKGQLESTHLKSSPSFTSWRKFLGRDSPSVHLVLKQIG